MSIQLTIYKRDQSESFDTDDLLANLRAMASSYTCFKMGTTSIALDYIPHVQSVSVGVWIKVGGRHEQPHEHGVAHFIEHMLFKGTSKRSALSISQDIESRGGDINAFTSEEMTCYYARLPAKHLSIALDVLLDMVRNSKFSPKEIEHERGVIQEEIRMYDDQPSVVAHEHLNGLLWTSQSLGRPLTGTLQSVGSHTRGTLLKFWRKYYHPANTIITVSGNVNEATLKGLLRKYLPKKSAPIPQNLIPLVAKETFQKGVRATFVKKSVQQINLVIGAYSYSRNDSRRFAQRLLSVILGENSSSRLFQSLREKYGLVYSVGTSVAQFADTGAFYIHAGLEPKNYAKVLDVIFQELRAIKNKSISSKELQQAKDFTVGQLHLNLESSTNQVMWMGEGIVGYGYVPDPNEWAQLIEKVTAKEIQQVAQEIFQPERMTVVAVGKDLKQRTFKGKLSL